jgi:hypothetical protein
MPTKKGLVHEQLSLRRRTGRSFTIDDDPKEPALG